MKDGLAYDHDTLKSLSQLLERKVKDLDRAIRFNFSVIAPRVVEHAKRNDVGNYKDRTGNLRSSIGYILVKNGRTIQSNFEAVHGGSESGEKGVKEATSYAHELAKKAGEGYTLLIVAGKNYARHVEGLKGYNVLTKSGFYMEKEINIMIERVLKKAGFK